METLKTAAAAKREEKIAATQRASRLLLDQIADKWSVLVLAALCDGPLRFNAIKRALDTITQKALTECLRRLERNGLVSRQVINASPIAVQYEITPLGRTLKEPVAALRAWTVNFLPQVEKAQARFDLRASNNAPHGSSCDADSQQH